VDGGKKMITDMGRHRLAGPKAAVRMPGFYCFFIFRYSLCPSPNHGFVMSLVQPQILPPTLTQKAANDVPLTRKLLEQALADLSERLYRSFQRQVRLVVHGGAVMVLHKSFNHRESTNDVDYIHRSFVSEHRALGFPHAEHKLRSCIADTARKFDLGADWMNDHADVALPWALECVK
jgi:hypothetical protein